MLMKMLGGNSGGNGSGTGGSTNFQTSHGGPAPGHNTNRNDPNIGGSTEWQQNYDPAELAKNLNRERVRSIKNNGPTLMKVTVKGGTPPQESIQQDFKGIMKTYKDDAEKSLEKQAIPQEYRDLVRQYYERFEK